MQFDQDHYTIKQLADMWHLAYNTVKKLFLKEPGVITFQAAPVVKGHRRGYTTRRIPREIAERVYNRMRAGV